MSKVSIFFGLSLVLFFSSCDKSSKAIADAQQQDIQLSKMFWPDMTDTEEDRIVNQRQVGRLSVVTDEEGEWVVDQGQDGKASFDKQTVAEFTFIQVAALFRGNLFEVFPQLEDQYNTPLKKKIFKESKEYKDLVTTAKSAMETVKKTVYECEPKELILEYDIQKKAFPISIDNSSVLYDLPPVGFHDYVLFPGVKFRFEIQTDHMSQTEPDNKEARSWLGFSKSEPARKWVKEYLDFSVPETRAVKYDGNKARLVTRYIPTGVGSVRDNDYPIAGKASFRLIDNESEDIIGELIF